MTERPLNTCKDCGDTWYPKGRDLSRRCPNCGSRNVDYAPIGGGCLVVLVIAGVVAAIHYFGDSSSQPEQPKPSTPTQAIQPARFASEAEARRAAVKMYPSLGVAGSTLNGEFLVRYNKYQREKPQFFKDVAWPVALAKECAASLGIQAAQP